MKLLLSELRTVSTGVRAQPCFNLAISATSVAICGMSSGIRNGFVTYIT